jgi:hypothetical protein
VTVAPQVYGVRETLKELKTVEPKLRAQVTREAKRAAEPLRADAQRRVPTTAPMSGWREEWTPANTRVTVRFGGRARGDKEVWPLLRLMHARKEGAMFDISGRKSDGETVQGKQFVANLRRTDGDASRSLWPAAEAMLAIVQRVVLKAIEDEMDSVSRNLVYRER